MPEMSCPRCPGLPLQSSDVAGRRAYACGRCDGHAVTVAAVRQSTDPATFAALWASVLQRAMGGSAPCPVCARAMQAVMVPVDSLFGSVEVDVCSPCQLFWFDARERAQVAQAAPPSSLDEVALSAEVRALLGQEQVRLDADLHRMKTRNERLAEVAGGGAPSTDRLGAAASALAVLAEWWSALSS